MKNTIARYREIAAVSLPLVFSMAATTVMEFTDRIFLANYSLDAIAAAMPAGIAAFLVLTLFTGVATYLNVFIAQYSGAGEFHRVGPCVWQGLYFAFLSAILLYALSFLSGPIFRLAGHAPEVQRLENIYFSILCRGGGINVVGAGLACFFSGRGKTRPVMVISIIGMVFNIPLDYALINGVGFFPALGIEGAALATVSSWTLIALLYGWLIFNRDNERQFGILSRRALDVELLGRIIAKGIPAALQFALDVLAFTFFVFLVGRLGKIELATTNMVLSIQSIAFMPAFGFSMGLSTLVGQSLGRNDPDAAVRFTHQTLKLLLSYTAILGLFFLVTPGAILRIFLMAESSAVAAPQLMAQGIGVMRIMTVLIAFDAMYFTFIGVLKGAGDTRFIMWTIGVVGLLVMALPLIVIVKYTTWGLYGCWGTLTVYVISLFGVTLMRYRQGRWKTIRVI